MYISDGGLHGLCVWESGSWCRSLTPGNLLGAPDRACSAELDGFSAHLLEIGECHGFRGGCEKTPGETSRKGLVIIQRRPACLQFKSAVDGRKPEIFSMKKHRLTFLCRRRWMVNCDQRQRWLGKLQCVFASQTGLGNICTYSILCILNLL